MTSVQDYPARLGYRHVGVPPSGPMDALSFRIANRLFGNAEGAPGLECTVTGPTLRSDAPTSIAVTGPHFSATLNHMPVYTHTVVDVAPGDTLELPQCGETGARAYIAFRVGLDIPRYLGSASTFTLGKFGGHGGRAPQGARVTAGQSLVFLRPEAA